MGQNSPWLPFLFDLQLGEGNSSFVSVGWEGDRQKLVLKKTTIEKL
jgi:hypothetical protein